MSLFLKVLSKREGPHCPGVSECECGAPITLDDPLDNVCSMCGNIYNMCGQQMRCLARDIDPADCGERYDDDY